MKRHTMLAALAVGFSLLAVDAHAAATKKSAPKQISGVINLNQATAAQLDLLPGVGPKAADRIVAFRAKTPFSRPEDLVKVKGFGKKKLDKLRGHLTVAGPTTLKVGPGKEDVGAPAEAAAAQGRGAPAAKR